MKISRLRARGFLQREQESRKWRGSSSSSSSKPSKNRLLGLKDDRDLNMALRKQEGGDGQRGGGLEDRFLKGEGEGWRINKWWKVALPLRPPSLDSPDEGPKGFRGHRHGGHCYGGDSHGFHLIGGHYHDKVK
ncbi:hypothetical protein BHE74_00054920 [Ensete ventricosum]|nr:hypothetical protein BHE74_00054920 [Ensete ventricosum]